MQRRIGSCELSSKQKASPEMTILLKQAVGANLGVSILSQHVLSRELTAGLVKSIPLAIGVPVRDLYLVYLDGRHLSPAALAFPDLHAATKGGETPASSDNAR